jgi:protein-S-isoprenylcysteine O-methyltransferase Ste14
MPVVCFVDPTTLLLLMPSPIAFLELKIPPPAVGVVLGLGMWVVSDWGASIQSPLPVRYAALAIGGIGGGALAIAGDVAFNRAQTTINPFRPQNTSTLVTSGVYRATRNPMYLGMLAVLLGWSVFLGSALALLGPIAFVAYITRFQIIPEERVLLAKFGSVYGDYARNVRRWL